jgi:hypothetical protein
MLPAGHDRELHYAALKARLESLRVVFLTGIKAEAYSALFNEFLAEWELGLALEVLCDFLLEPNVPPVSEVELNEIASLHTLMEVEDQCFLRLREKRRDLENAREHK